MSTEFNFDFKSHAYPEVLILKLLGCDSLVERDLRKEAAKQFFFKLEVNFTEQSYLIPKAGVVAEPMAENRGSEAWSEFKQIVNNLYANRQVRVATLRLVNELHARLCT